MNLVNNKAAVPLPVVNVAVAVVQREDGRVLLAERPRGKVSAGYWEFPGGKFEFGERAEQALARELHEELGVELDAAYPWVTYEHAYADKIVRLHFYRVVAWRGTPHGREGQRVSWENPAAVNVSPLLPANDKVLQALNLPSVYAVTQVGKYGVAEFLPRLQAALERGVRLIQIRERAMAPDQLAQFARRVILLARRYHAAVFINGDSSLAQRVGADGVHFSSAQLMRLSCPPAMRLWAATCHDHKALAHAAKLGANFVVLSQSSPISTRPEVDNPSWASFRKLIRDYPLPVYADSDVPHNDIETAMRHGAHGIVLTNGIW